MPTPQELEKIAALLRAAISGKLGGAGQPGQPGVVPPGVVPPGGAQQLQPTPDPRTIPFQPRPQLPPAPPTDVGLPNSILQPQVTPSPFGDPNATGQQYLQEILKRSTAIQPTPIGPPASPNVDAGVRGREAHVAAAGPATAPFEQDFLQPGDSPISPVKPKEGPIGAGTEDLFTELKQKSAALDKAFKNFSNKSFAPDFDRSRAALASARPDKPDEISTLQQVVALLGGASQAIAGIDPVPGNFGAAVAAAGGGVASGAGKVLTEEQRRKERFESLNKSVSLAEAESERQFALSKATGDRQAALAGLQAMQQSFKSAVDMAKLQLKGRELKQKSITDALDIRAKKLANATAQLALEGNLQDFHERQQAKTLKVDKDLIATGGYAFAVASSVESGTAGTPEIRATVDAAAKLAVVQKHRPGVIGDPPDPLEVEEEYSRLLQLDRKGIEGERSDTFITILTERLTGTKGLGLLERILAVPGQAAAPAAPAAAAAPQVDPLFDQASQGFTIPRPPSTPIKTEKDPLLNTIPAFLG